VHTIGKAKLLDVPTGAPPIRHDKPADVQLVDVDINRCSHSRFNTRKTRDPQRVELLAERIRRNGFERTRGLWGVEQGGRYEIFAGGTRLEAARRAGLTTVPVFVHHGLSDEQISRKSDQDNENDEYHAPVSLPDIWTECYRLYREEGWTQQRIAEAKGWTRQLVNVRIRWHETLPDNGRTAVFDGLLDEGHVQAVSSVTLVVADLQPWLTTGQAQSELIEEVLSKPRGPSARRKPTVRVVREAAARWKSLIEAAEAACASLPEGPWRTRFVDLLVSHRVRTKSALSRLLGWVVEEKRRQEEAEVARLLTEADTHDQEALRLKREYQRLRFLEAQTGKLRLGDAEKLIGQAPRGFSLLLTTPSYSKGETLRSLQAILSTAFAMMAENATCLIFTGWRREPELRQAVAQAGFTIRGSLVWVTNGHSPGQLAGSFASQHERIIHATKGLPQLQRHLPDVLYGRDRYDDLYPASKPRDLLRQLIEATTEPGATVVDPFMGGGDTLLEAYATGRDFFGIDIAPHWHQVAVERIHGMAEAELAGRAPAS
jgi:ParB-like chromosome segregation protein Spo0J